MIVMFLQATAALFTDLLGVGWTGSMLPGTYAALGSLAEATSLS
ncbi:hypothetical protein [Rhodococcus sp. KBS0724]|nr:hypothetical protein [Rhodococcus sp. KBS0724]